MIISRTPFRVSLFGGGTDYPEWFEKHGGSVLGFAIDKYCYISVRHLPPFFDHKHRIVYSKVENVKSIDEIAHPAVKAVLGEHKITTGLEIHHDGDLPARSGLGSSSSFTVGLCNALAAYDGKLSSKRALANEAIRIEHDVINEQVGCQDQVWAAYGGLNRINFLSSSTFDVQPSMITRDRCTDLEEHLLLVFTGVSRLAPAMAEKLIANLDAREQQLKTMMAMVDEAEAILHDYDCPITKIGELLNESWQLKRELADGVSSQLVDDIYEAAMAAGASGGKLLGAGGGGFMIFIVEPSKRTKVLKALKDLVAVKIKIDNAGSKIVVYEPEGLEFV